MALTSVSDWLRSPVSLQILSMLFSTYAIWSEQRRNVLSY